MIEINTKRLILEPLNLKHATQTYVDWLNDPEIYKYLETRGNQTLNKITEYILSQKKNKVFTWAITTKKANKHIGNIKVDPVNNSHQFGEFGILLGDKNEMGKGYAKEASLAVLNYFFTKNNPLRKINLGVIKDNIDALKLYKKIGFSIEGKLKKHLIYDEVEYDVIRMAILKDEFLNIYD